jgi:hypothetical protein
MVLEDEDCGAVEWRVIHRMSWKDVQRSWHDERSDERLKMDVVGAEYCFVICWYFEQVFEPQNCPREGYYHR